MPEVHELSKNPKVFVSYSHDDEAHKRRVLELADRLCDCGIDAILDQYETFPEQRWPAWCKQQIEDADHVLLVCTETYHRRVDGRETDGEGLGVCWEAPIIQQLLYDAGGRGSRKVIPVLFAGATAACIPTEARGFARFVVDREDGFEDLCRVLLNKPRRPKPPLGAAPALPPEERPWLAAAATMRAAAEPGSHSALLVETDTPNLYSSNTDAGRTPQREATSGAPTQRPNTADSEPERRSAENAKRFEDLKRQVGKILRGSTGVMAALQQAFAVTSEGKRDHGEEVAAQVDLLMRSTFADTKAALVEARKTIETREDTAATAAIAKLSKLLLPWLYIAGKKIDNFWCGAYRGGDIVALPAGLDTMAEIIMAGLDRREVLFQGGPWPVGELSVPLPESGITDRTETTLRDDLWKKLSKPSDFPFESKTDNVKDRAIAILLDDQRKLGKRLYLICRGEPLREPDRTLYSEAIRRIAARYESLCVVELDQTDDRQTDDMEIFADIRRLLHSVEG